MKTIGFIGLTIAALCIFIFFIGICMGLVALCSYACIEVEEWVERRQAGRIDQEELKGGDV